MRRFKELIIRGLTTGFRLPVGVGIFPFVTTSRPGLGPTYSPIQLVPGALFMGGEAKRPGHEADQPLTSS